MLLHDHRLCVYAAGGLVVDALATHGGGWRFTGTTRVGYSDPLRLPDGISKISLRADVNGQGKALPVSVQLQAAHGPCWGATFSATGLKQHVGGVRRQIRLTAPVAT